MSKKYMAMYYCNPQIKLVEVDYETVYFVQHEGHRRRKKSDGCHYVDTFDEAKDIIIEALQIKVSRKSRALKSAERDLLEAEALKENV